MTGTCRLVRRTIGRWVEAEQGKCRRTNPERLRHLGRERRLGSHFGTWTVWSNVQVPPIYWICGYLLALPRRALRFWVPVNCPSSCASFVSIPSPPERWKTRVRNTCLRMLLVSGFRCFEAGWLTRTNLHHPEPFAAGNTSAWTLSFLQFSNREQRSLPWVSLRAQTHRTNWNHSGPEDRELHRWSWRNEALDWKLRWFFLKSAWCPSPAHDRPICSTHTLCGRLVQLHTSTPRTRREPNCRAGRFQALLDIPIFCKFQQLRQRATEWQKPLWVAAIDFKKAFKYSRKLYDLHWASRHTDVRRKYFHLERRTTQGHLLKTFFLNSLLQYIMMEEA